MPNFYLSVGNPVNLSKLDPFRSRLERGLKCRPVFPLHRNNLSADVPYFHPDVK